MEIRLKVINRNKLINLIVLITAGRFLSSYFRFSLYLCKIDLKWSQVILKNQFVRLIGKNISASDPVCTLVSWAMAQRPMMEFMSF